jgi:hypothetical protein
MIELIFIHISNLENFFISDPRFKDEVPMEYLSHKERYEHAVRKSCILFKKVKEWQQFDESASNFMDIYKYESISIPIFKSSINIINYLLLKFQIISRYISR